MPALRSFCQRPLLCLVCAELVSLQLSVTAEESNATTTLTTTTTTRTTTTTTTTTVCVNRPGLLSESTWDDGNFTCEEYTSDMCLKNGSIAFPEGAPNDQCCTCGGGATYTVTTTTSTTLQPTCAAPSVPEHGSLQGLGYYAGDARVLVCAAGYHVTGGNAVSLCSVLTGDFWGMGICVIDGFEAVDRIRLRGSIRLSLTLPSGQTMQTACSNLETYVEQAIQAGLTSAQVPSGTSTPAANVSGCNGGSTGTSQVVAYDIGCPSQLVAEDVRAVLVQESNALLFQDGFTESLAAATEGSAVVISAPAPLLYMTYTLTPWQYPNSTAAYQNQELEREGGLDDGHGPGMLGMIAGLLLVAISGFAITSLVVYVFCIRTKEAEVD